MGAVAAASLCVANARGKMLLALTRRAPRHRPRLGRSIFSALGSPPRHDFSIRDEVECTPAQLFAIVADVDRYSEFLPFCTSSRVLQRHGSTSFEAKLSLGFLGFAEEYSSKVTLRPPYSVAAQAADSQLFSHMHTEWRLEEGPRQGTCALDFRLEMQLCSLVQDHALRRVLDKIAAQQVAAFKKRCVQMYGSNGTAGGGWFGTQATAIAAGRKDRERASDAAGNGGIGGRASGGNGDGGVGGGSRPSEAGAVATAVAPSPPSAAKGPPAARASGTAAETVVDGDAVGGAEGGAEGRAEGRAVGGAVGGAAKLQIELDWRRSVEGAFDSHQVAPGRSAAATTPLLLLTPLRLLTPPYSSLCLLTPPYVFLHLLTLLLLFDCVSNTVATTLAPPPYRTHPLSP